MGKKKEVKNDWGTKPKVPVKPSEWVSILKTVVEDSDGEHCLVDLQQNTGTKDIRVVRV